MATGVGIRGVAETLLIVKRGTLIERYKATWNRDFKLPWREAGQPNHLDDEADSDQ